MSSPDATRRPRLLLVGWDSADWKIIHPMIDRGELPALKSLIEGGTSGNLATLEPQLSPMLWTSIASGKMAYHHGVAGFTEVDPPSGRVVPVSAATRRCKMLWEMLGESGLKSHVVGWFATQGERDLNGCMVSNLHAHLKDVKPDQDPADWPAPPPGTYWPPELAADLDELRVSPLEIDPDQIVRLFVPRAPEVDQTKDQRLALLVERLAEAYSVQAAATWLMEHRADWDFMAVYYRAIDEISHIFMPFHPPRMEGVPERDFEIYRGVVEMTYRVHDLMLQRLLELAGPDTAVMLVSDHGFHSDHLRPRYTPNVPAGITVWHRNQGVVVMKGEGFQCDSLIHGARLLDIAPSILHWFGLPVGQDMEGRVLVEAFSEATPILTIPTWEASGEASRHRVSLSEDESQALLDQFVKLGYIDEIPADADLAAIETRRENSWNLARANLYGGRFEQALPLLEDCHFAFPERSDHAQLLARCQLALGLLDEADETAATALATAGYHGGARLIQAYIALEKGEKRRALELLEQVQAEDPEAPLLLHYLSLAYISLHRWDDAEATARKILAGDPANVQGHLALTRCHIHQNRLTQAVESALDAIAHDFSNPRGHFLLGTALFQSNDWKNAAPALERAIQFGRGVDAAPAHRMLATIANRTGDLETSTRHYLQSRLAHRETKVGSEAVLARLRAEIAHRAETREAARREQRAKHSPASTLTREPLDFLIVSGLPRSGTSLMMQILVAGGIEPMTDGLRHSDTDNPEGYFEWEEIKTLPRNPRVIEKAHGKVTKVISALLPHLPVHHRYKVIFMTRPVHQIARSQEVMIRNRGGETSDRARMEATLQIHADEILSSLRKAPNIDLLEVPYPELVAYPEAWMEQLTRFLPEHFQPSPTAKSAINPALFRNT
jgi:predicted AlkP superfamily phosphohydrolase/phosphomutase/tetratricopeptide (TPR) repeat protein